MVTKVSALTFFSNSNLLSTCAPLSRIDPTSAGITVHHVHLVRPSRHTYPTVPHAEDRISHAPWPTCANPTPYDILNHPKGVPYSKARFYELAKLYHPDRSDYALPKGLPAHTCLERYRLAVTANKILGDPEKRRLYDMYGIGWGSEIGPPHSDINEAYRRAYKHWRRQAGNTSQNGTWEDWERWRAARDGTMPRQPLFQSDNSFILAVIFFVVLGWYGQAVRIENHRLSVSEALQRQHNSISSDIRERQNQAVFRTRQDRVDAFLQNREDSVYARQWSPDNNKHL